MYCSSVANKLVVLYKFTKIVGAANNVQIDDSIYIHIYIAVLSINKSNPIMISQQQSFRLQCHYQWCYPMIPLHILAFPIPPRGYNSWQIQHTLTK
jgi:hypothetical protein